MSKTLNVYQYEGPVLSFGRVVKDTWSAVTCAVSEKAARNNLAYRYKMEHGLSKSSRINLPDKVYAVGTVPEKSGQMSLEDITF